MPQRAFEVSGQRMQRRHDRAADVPAARSAFGHSGTDRASGAAPTDEHNIAGLGANDFRRRHLNSEPIDFSDAAGDHALVIERIIGYSSAVVFFEATLPMLASRRAGHNPGAHAAFGAWR